MGYLDYTGTGTDYSSVPDTALGNKAVDWVPVPDSIVGSGTDTADTDTGELGNCPVPDTAVDTVADKAVGKAVDILLDNIQGTGETMY